MTEQFKISVVVPVRDEEDSIRPLLDGLLNQSFQPDEILITDGGSTDGTCRIVEEFAAQGAPVRLFRAGDSLPGRSRNIGASNARNEWLAFIDAGITPEPNWLESLVERAAAAETPDVIYGSYEPDINGFFTECAAIAYVPPRERTADGPTRPPSIASALIRRAAWKQVGGFPENLRSAEDLLFMNNLAQQGFRIVRAPAAVVHWTIQPDLGRTFKRFVLYASNNIRAGLWKSWQAPIFLRYTLIVLSATPALVVGVKWFVVPLALWLAMLLLRSVTALRRNRLTYPASTGRNVIRLMALVPLIASLDLATAVGSLRWLFLDRVRLG